MGLFSWLNARRRQGFFDAFATMGDLDNLRDDVDEQLKKVSIDMEAFRRDVALLSEFRTAQSSVNRHLVDRMQKAGVLPPDDGGGDVNVG